MNFKLNLILLACICYSVETGHLGSTFTLVVRYVDKRPPGPNLLLNLVPLDKKPPRILQPQTKDSPLFVDLALMFTLTCVTDVPVPAGHPGSECGGPTLPLLGQVENIRYVEQPRQQYSLPSS